MLVAKDVIPDSAEATRRARAWRRERGAPCQDPRSGKRAADSIVSPSLRIVVARETRR